MFPELLLCSASSGFGVLVLELFEQDARAFLENKKPTEDYAKAMACQGALALRRLHELSVAHLDVKPANILLLPTCRRAVLSDFSHSEKLSQGGCVRPRFATYGTPAYRSPEFYRNSGAITGNLISANADLWMFGCTVWEIGCRVRGDRFEHFFVGRSGLRFGGMCWHGPDGIRA